MSYTVAIQGKKPLDGSIVLNALAETSADFHDPASIKKAEGYIAVDQKTSVGIAFITSGEDEIRTVENRLKERPELEAGRVMVRSVNLGPNKVGVVNLLIPQPEFSFLAGVFGGVGSKLWLLENTGWWPEYEGEISVASPGIVYPKDKSPLIIFRVGTVTLYFDETKRNSQRTHEVYSGDERGYFFRRKHPDVHVSQVGDLLFAEEIDRHGYGNGFQRLVTDEGTGLSHGYTIVYFDELNHTLACAHLMHENTRGRFEKLKAIDREGNSLVIAGGTTAEYFLRHWPYEVNLPCTTIEGASLTMLDKKPKVIIEKIL